jgi:hypothetical protein
LKGDLKTPIHPIAFMNSWVGKYLFVDKCFPTQEFINDTRIIYPQYWIALDIKATFPIHLMLLKTHFHHPKTKSLSSTTVGPLLDSIMFD